MTAPKRISAAVSRPVRTAAQSGVGFAIVEFLDAFLWDMDDRQYGAAVVLLTIVLSWAQNLTENYLGKGFLRSVPPTTDPLP